MFYGKNQTYLATYTMILISCVIPCSILTGALDIYLSVLNNTLIDVIVFGISPAVIKLVEVIQDYEKGHST